MRSHDNSRTLPLLLAQGDTTLIRGGCIMTDKLNIVLVHGAFADGSHWRHIIPRLTKGASSDGGAKPAHVAG